MDRYQRQIQLQEIGVDGQAKISDAKVLIVGVGGLGCPALQYLAAAGVGYIGLVDFDKIELSNLQRQVLYANEDIGKLKVEIAAHKARQLNNEITIQPFNCQITNKNALEIIEAHDIVLDGSDNFATRYLLNDACNLLGKPLVYGAVLRFEGQVGVFNMLDVKTNLKTNYRDLFPSPPKASSSISCNDVGVLGVLPGIIGTMQAAEVIKIITGIGSILVNKVLSYNALTCTFYDFEVNGNPLLHFPQTRSAFLDYNYEWFCSSTSLLKKISVKNFDILRANQKLTVIDVREVDELPSVDEFEHISIPLSVLPAAILNRIAEKTIVVFCASGQRSLKAVSIIEAKFPDYLVYSLEGGIAAWKRNHTIKLNYNEK